MRNVLKTFKSRCRAASIAAVIAAVVFASVPVTLAYFSDYAKAAGSKDVKLGWQTELKEEVRENDKHITIDNVGETPVIVRVQVFADEDLATVQGDAWTDGGDGWWYYNSVLAPEETAEELLVDVKGSDELPDQAFNIVVVHESQRAVHESNSKLVVPDGWAMAPVVQ